VHYCLDDFTLKKALFGATEIGDATTAANIRRALIEYIKFVGLDANKMVCVVRDGAANVKKAAELMEKARLVFIYSFYINFFSFQCLAHILHLIVKDFVKSSSVKPIVEKSHKWARFLNKSGPALKLYERIQGEEIVPGRKIPTVGFNLL